MSNREERRDENRRKAIYSGNKGISRDVWQEAMRLTEQAERQRRNQTNTTTR